MNTKTTLRHFRGEKCLNCSTPMDTSDRFCSYCGQTNSTKKLTFNDFFNEFFAGLFAYDSKIYKTIFTLFFRPGKISEDYIKGKRNKYVNPFRFYLSVSIIFFIIWGFTRNEMDFETPSTDSLDLGVLEVNGDPVLAETEYDTEEELSKESAVNAYGSRFSTYMSFFQNEKITSPEKALEKLGHEKNGFNKWTYKKAVHVFNIYENPSLFINYIISKLPFIIFFFLPIFALFIWLLYLRRSFTYMEHLIFTFHNQTMAFLLFTLAVLMEIIFGFQDSTNIASFIFLFYLYKAMRHFYKQNRFKTIVKFVTLNVIFFILAFFGSAFAVLASFAMF